MPEAAMTMSPISPDIKDKRKLLQHSGIMGRTSPHRLSRTRGSDASPCKSVGSSNAKKVHYERPVSATQSQGKGSVAGHSPGSHSRAGHSSHSSRRGKQMSEQRLQKLLYLKQREEMKDILIHQVKEKFYKDNPEALRKRRKKLDFIIEEQVGDFCEKNAKLSKENLDRLMKHVENEVKGEDGDVDKKSHVSDYSHLSEMSNASRAGSVRDHIQRMEKARSGKKDQDSGNNDTGGTEYPTGDVETKEEGEIDTKKTIEDLMGFEWCRLDEFMNREAVDEEEEKKKKKEINRVELSAFLDEQVRVREERLARERDENYQWKYVVDEELEKFKKEDAEKEEQNRYLQARESRERDEAVALKHERIEIEKEMVRQEDIRLLAKVQREIEVAIEKEQAEKAKQKEIMLKTKADIDYAREIRLHEEAERKKEEMKRAKAYTKLLLKQEEERKAEMERRAARQKHLMEKMKATVQKAAADKGQEDERRARLQREEKETAQAEAEQAKVDKLKKLREDTRDYVLQQMQAKNFKKQEHQQVKEAQGGILLGDAEQFEADKVSAVEEKKLKGRSYVVELRKQIAERAARKVTAMSEQEVKLNKGAIIKVIEDEKKRGILRNKI